MILEDINDNFNLKNKLADVKISILYQQDTDFLLVDAVKYLQSFDCHTWQFLSLELPGQIAQPLKLHAEAITCL